jgi:hypothetical protein
VLAQRFFSRFGCLACINTFSVYFKGNFLRKPHLDEGNAVRLLLVEDDVGAGVGLRELVLVTRREPKRNGRGNVMITIFDDFLTNFRRFS